MLYLRIILLFLRENAETLVKIAAKMLHLNKGFGR
jgi:hypothetical protein